MRIKISNTNALVLDEAINAANGRATAHTLNRSTLLQWVASAEQRLADYAAGVNCPQHQVGQPWVKKETWRGDVVWVSEMEVAK